MSNPVEKLILAASKLRDESEVFARRIENDGIAESLVRKLTGDNSTGKVSYGTEAGQFQEEGYSTVICGPGSIEQAHQANEFLSRDQLNKGTDFIRSIINEHAN